MAGLTLHRWVFSWLCRWFPGRVRVRRWPVVRSFRPQVEELEVRVLLDASPMGQAASTFLGDLTHLGNDMAKAEIVLVNAAQTTPTNTPARIELANQWNSVTNQLGADVTQTRQALVQLLDASLQELDTLIADLYGYRTQQTSVPSQESSSNYAMTPPSLLGPSYQAPSPSVSLQPAQAHDPLYVLDRNTGETVPANVTLNTFSTWSENLLAQVSGGTVASYSWDLSQVPDASNVSGANTANLQFTWASFTGSARTDTIRVTETPQSGSPLTQTMTFLVAGTNSPAYSSTRPTSSSTWPAVITPGQTHLTFPILRLLFEDFLQESNIQGRFVTFGSHAPLAWVPLQ